MTRTGIGNSAGSFGNTALSATGPPVDVPKIIAKQGERGAGSGYRVDPFLDLHSLPCSLPAGPGVVRRFTKGREFLLQLVLKLLPIRLGIVTVWFEYDIESSFHQGVRGHLCPGRRKAADHDRFGTKSSAFDLTQQLDAIHVRHFYIKR
ncbi:hypothetical protein Poly41_59230 [Novipirellula artificiosorum]|uniref:Uncharacterized protein n=1 Tax=Novipirellula artificiosorum TaxID=2528016 RepID=A0A5C6D7K7_9BACT|nr:hypothetical protein [Novipirellula artificiosorum]TWU32035.1 hypothetical protein Poly41_59230 [Novipirellula artificiosorum]